MNDIIGKQLGDDAEPEIEGFIKIGLSRLALDIFRGNPSIRGNSFKTPRYDSVLKRLYKTFDKRLTAKNRDNVNYYCELLANSYKDYHLLLQVVSDNFLYRTPDFINETVSHEKDHKTEAVRIFKEYPYKIKYNYVLRFIFDDNDRLINIIPRIRYYEKNNKDIIIRIDDMISILIAPKKPSHDDLKMVEFLKNKKAEGHSTITLS